MAINANQKRILVLTQKVDINDDLLGFFHNWLEGLASRVDKLNVIALGVGEYHLPANVKVFSLGKILDNGGSALINRLKYVWNFYKYIWQLRNEYDAVFVHMNVEYVFLGAKFWWLWGKKIILWYAHYQIDWRARLAFWLSDKIVTSTANACGINSQKLIITGQGIDIDKFNKIPHNPPFSKGEQRGIFRILYLGRISPIKNLDLLIKIFGKLLEKIPPSPPFLKGGDGGIFLDIVGAPTPADGDYFKNIQKILIELRIPPDKIKFWGKTPNYKTIEFYNQADLYVNLTPTGSFDKTSLEAMACELPSLTCNQAFEEYFNDESQRNMIFKEGDEVDLQNKMERFLTLNKTEQEKIGREQREMVVKYHSLDNLINNLMKVFYE